MTYNKNFRTNNLGSLEQALKNQIVNLFNPVEIQTNVSKINPLLLKVYSNKGIGIDSSIDQGLAATIAKNNYNTEIGINKFKDNQLNNTQNTFYANSNISNGPINLNTYYSIADKLNYDRMGRPFPDKERIIDANGNVYITDNLALNAGIKSISNKNKKLLAKTVGGRSNFGKGEATINYTYTDNGKNMEASFESPLWNDINIAANLNSAKFGKNKYLGKNLSAFLQKSNYDVGFNVGQNHYGNLKESFYGVNGNALIGDGRIKGNYIVRNIPYDGKSTELNISGEYPFEDRLLITGDYNKASNNQRSNIEKGLALLYNLGHDSNVALGYKNNNGKNYWNIGLKYKF